MSEKITFSDPTAHMDRFVHRGGARALETALSVQMMSNGSPKRAKQILLILRGQVENLEKSHKLVRSNKMFQQIEAISRMRDERWKVFSDMYRDASAVAHRDCACFAAITGNESEARRCAAEIDEITDRMNELLDNTRHLRNAFFPYLLSSANQTANTSPDGADFARQEIELFYMTSIEYMANATAMRAHTKDVLKKNTDTDSRYRPLPD